jgi:hypothetical protein
MWLAPAQPSFWDRLGTADLRVLGAILAGMVVLLVWGMIVGWRAR